MRVMSAEAVLQVPVDEIEVAGNVRRRFDEGRLAELTESIRRVGILQPLVIRRGRQGERILVCGERRLRAARAAGLATVPAIIRDLDEHQAREAQLVENLQRQDLDPVEEAVGYQELLGQHGYKQEELGRRIGVSQSQVSNRLRLLRLPEEVQSNISREILTPGHGMALLKLEKAPDLLTRAAHHLVETQTSVARAAAAVDAFAAENGKPLDDRYYGGRRFKTTQCKSCEFRVSVKRWPSMPDVTPVCLNAECWDRRQAEAETKERAEVQREEGELRASGRATISKAELDKLPYTAYNHLSEHCGFDLAGCQGCASRKVRVGGPDGGQPLELCMDPTCFRKYQAAATRQATKAQREAAAEYAEEARAWAGQRADDGPGGDNLRLLAALVLLHVQADYHGPGTQPKVTTWLKKRVGWDLGQAIYDLQYHGWPSLHGKLASLSDHELLALALEWAAVARKGSQMLNEAMGRPLLADALGDEGDAAGEDDDAGAKGDEDDPCDRDCARCADGPFCDQRDETPGDEDGSDEDDQEDPGAEDELPAAGPATGPLDAEVLG